MEELIHHASEGREDVSIGMMYDTIRRHPTVLEEFDRFRLVETPLHAAAAAGRTGCALELLMMMPSWGIKLNTRGLTPLHMALHNRHSDTALALVRRDHTLVRARGVNGMTPLLYAAEVCTDASDDLNVMATFLTKCPDGIDDVNHFFESAVHCVMRSPGYRAKQLVVNWIMRTRRYAVLGWSDKDGNTALHILAKAPDDEYEEVVKMMVNLSEINVKNKEDKTPLDLAVEAGKLNVANILREAGGRGGDRVATNESIAAYLISPSDSLETITRWFCVMIKDLTVEMRNMVLVVAALLITTTYQVALEPPDNNGKQPKQNVVINNRKLMGEVMTTSHDHYNMAANTFIFTFSMLAVIFLLQARLYTAPLYAGLLFLAYSYIDILTQIVPESKSTFLFLFMSVICVMLIVGALALKCFYCFAIEPLLKGELWMPGGPEIINLRFGPWALRSHRRRARQWRLLMSTQADQASRNTDC